MSIYEDLQKLEEIAEKMSKIKSIEEAKKIEKEMKKFYQNNITLPHYIVRQLYYLSSLLVIDEIYIEKNRKRALARQKKKGLQ